MKRNKIENFSTRFSASLDGFKWINENIETKYIAKIKKHYLNNKKLSLVPWIVNKTKASRWSKLSFRNSDFFINLENIGIDSKEFIFKRDDFNNLIKKSLIFMNLQFMAIIKTHAKILDHKKEKITSQKI